MDLPDDGLDLVGDDLGGCLSPGLTADWGRDPDWGWNPDPDICDVGRGDPDIGLEFGSVEPSSCLGVPLTGLLKPPWEAVPGQLPLGVGDPLDVWSEDSGMTGRNWHLSVNKGNKL